MKKTTLVLFALMLPLGLQGSTKPMQAIIPKLKTLSMSQAVEEAFIRKPSIHAYTYAIKDAERQRKNAFASVYMPNIAVSETMHNAKYSGCAKNSFGVSASQTIFNFPQQDYYKRYNTIVSTARNQKEAHKEDIRFATETAFLNGWLLQQQLESIILFYKSSKETYDKAKNQHKNGLLDKNDWMTAEATHAQNLATINSYRESVEQIEKELTYYTGRDIALIPPSKKKKALPPTCKPIKLVWTPQRKTRLEKLGYYYDEGLKRRKDIKIQQNTIDLEKHTSRYYAKQYLPSVKLFMSGSKTTYWRKESTFNKNAGLEISWNIFDGMSNYINKRAADARKMKAILEKNDLVAKVKLDIKKAYSNLLVERKKLEAQNSSYNQARNELELKKQQINTGLISAADFKTAQYSYENAHVAWLNQVITTALKKQELLFTCDYPHE